MKIKHNWYVILAIMLVFAGCKSNPKEAELDSRDAFVGTYDYVTKGEMTLVTVLPEIEPTLPLNTEGMFKIEKVGKNNDTVLISGAIDGKAEPFKAIVNKNQLEFVNKSIKIEGKNFSVTTTADNTTATMANDTLTWAAGNVSCEGTLYFVNVSGQGFVSMKAHKKSVAAGK